MPASGSLGSILLGGGVGDYVVLKIQNSAVIAASRSVLLLVFNCLFVFF